MFVKEIDSGFLSCHPKKVALKQDLERIRDSINDISRGSIDITLIYVQFANLCANRVKFNFHSGKRRREICVQID